MNHNRDEGETMLAPQGWVNYLNVTEQLAAAGARGDDEINKSTQIKFWFLRREENRSIRIKSSRCRVEN